MYEGARMTGAVVLKSAAGAPAGQLNGSEGAFAWGSKLSRFGGECISTRHRRRAKGGGAVLAASFERLSRMPGRSD